PGGMDPPPWTARSGTTTSTRSPAARVAGTSTSPTSTLVSRPASAVPRRTRVSPTAAYGNTCSVVAPARRTRSEVIVGAWIVWMDTIGPGDGGASGSGGTVADAGRPTGRGNTRGRLLSIWTTLTT